jgi:hypothetical protein
MMQPERFYSIPGRIIDQQKILHETELVIVARPMSRQAGTENASISEIRFARRQPVPDGGPYTLQYTFNGIQHEDQVRIKQGVLIAI